MLTNSNRYLKKTPIPVGKKRLEKAMSRICAEYSSLVGSVELTHSTNLRKAITNLQLKVVRVENLLILAAYQDVEAELKEVCGTANPQQVVIRLKNLRIELEGKVKELRKLEGKKDGDVQHRKENLRKVYGELESALSKYLGFPIMERSMSVQQVAGYQNLLKNENRKTAKA